MHHSAPLWLSCSLAAALAACGGGSDAAAPDAATPDAAAPDAAGTATVTVTFAELVAGQPVAIGNDTPYTDAAGDAFGVTAIRYFVADLTLVYADDTEVAFPGAHYVDHDLPDTATYALTGAPVGDLAAIRFVMGLPPALNVTGAFTQPPESLMEWPEMMGGGYHFMKFEGHYVDNAAASVAYHVHSGATGGVDYSFPVELDAGGRAVTGAGAAVTVEMNLEEWLTNPNTWDLDDYFNATHPGIMNDAAAQQSLQENGATVFTLAAP